MKTLIDTLASEQNPITQPDNRNVRDSFALRAVLTTGLVAIFGLMSTEVVSAQTFAVLHQFAATNGAAFTTFTNNEGAYPRGGVILAGDTLYGTTSFGGSSGGGTLFRVKTDGSDFTVLHQFTGASDGIAPRSALFLSGDTLYGTAKTGGSTGNGTVFKVRTDGTGFVVLHHFTAINPNTGANGDGSQPIAELILSGSTLYGTAAGGGSSGYGTVFKVSTNGTGFANLHSFTNSDGAAPYGGLVLSGSTLYGTASAGGPSDNGTVFAINTDGTGFTNLYFFSSTPGPFRPNSDGALPIVSLLLSSNMLYGAAGQGGATGNGTVFALNTNGSDFRVLYAFTAVPDPDNPPYINDDGATPTSALTLVGNTLYGTTQVGGSVGAGTVFALSTDGTGFTNLHTFTGDDGANPFGTLILSGNTIYGTASSIYISSIFITNFGAVFNLSLAPQLTIAPSGADVILTWPIDAPGFSYASYQLQSTAELGAAAGWTTVQLPAPPVVANGQYIATIPNAVTNTQKFFRLRQ